MSKIVKIKIKGDTDFFKPTKANSVVGSSPFGILKLDTRISRLVQL